MKKSVRLLSSTLALTLFLTACSEEPVQESGNEDAEEQTSEQPAENENTTDTEDQTEENNESAEDEEASNRENDETTEDDQQQEDASNTEEASTENTSSDSDAATEEDSGSTEEEASADTSSDAAEEDTNATVTNVVDGDTIDVEYEGGEERIRLILVDTLETKHPQMGVQPFGPEATEFTSSELDGEDVRLELGVEERDYYGRLLAYVFLDGENFNQQLIEEGLARVAVYPPNTEYLDEFEAAEEDARSAGIGIWSLEDYVTDDGYEEQDDDEETSEDSSDSEETDSSSGNASPDQDCSDFDTQSDAQEHWDENGYSADNDPERLDGDGDGVPCDALPSGSNSSGSDETSSSDSGSTEDSDSSGSEESSEDVYYDNCDAARDAGAAPVREGDPGYGGHLDRDGDGVGCET